MKSLHNFMLIMKYIPNNNVQQQFVYFILTICCNTFVSFSKEKLHTLNTKETRYLSVSLKISKQVWKIIARYGT